MISYGQNESYSQGYASGLDNDSFTCKPSGSQKLHCTGAHGVPALKHQLDSDDYVYMHSHNVHNHPHVHHPKYQNNYGNVYGTHSNLDSSYAEESETEYSDEEKEYVYYVNRPSNQTASHV